MNANAQEPAAGNGDRRYGLVDVTLRDAHQCLWSTRMTTSEMTPILSRIDEVGYEYINILGGAVFDVQVRFLKENPWERVGLLCERFRTPCDGLTRGQSLYTFELFPDDIVELNSKVLARRGLKVLTVYDALNDNRNIESSVRSAHEAGMLVNAMMTYTLSPVHTDAYYVERTRELVALKSDFISVKDPTGLLTPERAKTLFPAVIAAADGIPLQLHMHTQSGLATQVHEVAMLNGFRYGHTASEPLANGASHPALKRLTITRAPWDSQRVSIDARLPT
jgi:oxaloacetate decarboxylase alpha subunit